NPIVPVNGGTNADGSLTSLAYDRATFNLPFRADFALYFKSGYQENRSANGSGGWNSAVTTGMTYAQSGAGGGQTNEISIPWTAFPGGVRPASFNWYGQKVYDYGAANNGIYGQVPVENPTGAQNVSAYTSNSLRYYTVSVTTVGSSTLPFSRNSYTHPFGVTNNSFGAISVWDFTMNSSGQQIARLNTGGDWTINNSLVVAAGTLYFGSGGSGYGQSTIANIDIRGGSLNMDQTNKALNTSGNFVMSSGSFLLSGTSGGDFNLAGNWTTSGGTFTPSSRRVTFNGTAAQTLTGATTFDYLTFNNTSGANPAVTLANSITANQDLVLTNGIVQIGANNITVTNTTAAAVSSAASTAFVQTNSTGQLRRSIATAGLPITYLFPVGTGTTYSPASFSFSANNTARNLHVRAVAGTHPSNGTPTHYIANRYWNTDLSSTSGTYTYTSQFNYQAGDVTGTLASIKLGKYNGSTWTDDAGSSASGTVLSSGTLTETTGSLAATADWAGRTTVVPSIAISGVAPGASTEIVGTTNVILHQYNLAVTVLNATLTGLNVVTAGTYATADITNLKVRYSTDATLDGGDATLSTLTSPGTAGTLTFPSFTSQLINTGTTGYIFITADIAGGATAGNTINIASNPFSNFTFTAGTKTGTDPVGVAGVKTFSSSVPSIAISNSAPASSNQNAGTTDVVLQRLDFAVTVAGTNFTGLTVTTAGTYASADLTNLKVRFSTDAT
ncbi:MAG TPA: hypothetical protein PL185_10630, partial [Flavobacteriales bacterium]|nr:hypothetical protein [Flavobacteriales bacterium]